MLLLLLFAPVITWFILSLAPMLMFQLVLVLLVILFLMLIVHVVSAVIRTLAKGLWDQTRLIAQTLMIMRSPTTLPVR